MTSAVRIVAQMTTGMPWAAASAMTASTALPNVTPGSSYPVPITTTEPSWPPRRRIALIVLSGVYPSRPRHEGAIVRRQDSTSTV